MKIKSIVAKAKNWIIQDEPDLSHITFENPPLFPAPPKAPGGLSWAEYRPMPGEEAFWLDQVRAEADYATWA